MAKPFRDAGKPAVTGQEGRFLLTCSFSFYKNYLYSSQQVPDQFGFNSVDLDPRVHDEL